MKNRHKRIRTLLLAVILILSLISTAAAKGSPYYIRVNRATCTVTIYATDSAGKPAQPLKAMVCSVGKPGKGITPTGTYTLTSYRPQWCKMKDGSYGAYISQFKGNYLFHSVCYRKKDLSTLITEEYNDLGNPASLGCVRLQTGDAKWIYENCPAGTKVDIFSGSPSDDPLGKPEKLVSYIDPADPDSGWDPTSTDGKNPWPTRLSAMSEAEPAAETPEPSAEPEPAAKSAAPTNDKLTVDGGAAAPTAYKIDGSNYFKLRDVAALLNGSAKQFDVTYDSVNQAVVITTGKGYTKLDTDLQPTPEGKKAATTSNNAVYIDGAKVDLTVYKINGNNYFKLRDLGEKLDFYVSWTAERGMFIETDKGYDPNS